MRKSIFILFFGALAAFGQETEKPKIEMYVYDQRCVPIEHVLSTESFYTHWYSAAKKIKPKSVPILTDYDIEEFDIENFTLTIGEEGWNNFKDLAIPTNGIPVFLVVNDEVAYGAWIWTPLSSLACPGIAINFIQGSEERKMTIDNGTFEQESRIPEALK